MKTGKRVLSVFLVALMLLTAVPLAGFVGLEFAPKAKAYNVGDTIQYGTYPQTRVEETTALKNAADAATWKSYDYYTGTGTWDDGNIAPSDYMRFADFFCGEVKYRAVKFMQYRPLFSNSVTFYTNQNVNGYEPDNIYYFEYEPLTWQVLDPSVGFIMCESIVDSQAFHNTIYERENEYYQTIGSFVYANDYEASSIRAWLNYDFYETAFTDEQKDNIKTTALNNDAYSANYAKYNSAATNDKIFLLSYADVLNTAYGFSSDSSTCDRKRMVKGTDYAKCQGLNVFREEIAVGNSWWWLRSSGDTSGSVCKVDGYGNVNIYYGVSGTQGGIRPACKLSNLASDVSISETLFSDDEGFPFQFHQKRVVGDSQNKYSQYSRLYGGEPMDGTEGNPDLCIPGLDAEDDMIPQGMTYYPAKNWILISAYDAKEKNESVIYALDYSNGNYVAEYHLYDNDNQKIINHVGGIAVSDNYLFIATGKTISYISLSTLENKTGKAFNIKTEGEKSLSTNGFLGTNASVSYLNYSEGVLWAGNFFYSKESKYNVPVSETTNSRIIGFNISSSDDLNGFKNCSSPLYIIDIDKSSSNEIDRIQCATYANGILYISSSYGRKNDSSMYAGILSLVANGCVRVSASSFTKHTTSPMSEGMFVKADYMYVLSESAAYQYNGKSDEKSKNPLDVVWRYSLSFAKPADYNLGDETYSFENYTECIKGQNCYGNAHCFGMSATSSMYYLGLLNKSVFGGDDKDSLYTYSNNSQIRAPICHYQGIQGKTERDSIVAGGYIDKHLFGEDTQGDWNACVNYVKNHQYDNKGNLQVGSWYNNGGGHAVNFLYYNEVNGQQRIYVYDNNFPEIETYYYMGNDGLIYQAPMATSSDGIKGIDLMNIDIFFSLAKEFKSSRHVYASVREITVDNADVYYMKGGPSYSVLFEIPDEVDSITITPLVDNATFTYMDQIYTFGEIDENTYGILTLAETEDGLGELRIETEPHTHTYTATVTTPATCTEPGAMTYTCVDGDDTYTETIPALGHTDDNNDGYCDNCGEQMQGGDHCKFCGKIHNGGFFDKLTGFFHKIFAIFKR